MILGYSFLAITNPELDWKKGTMKGTVVTSTHDAHKWKVLSQIQKTTTLRQLAIKEAGKKLQQTWDQIVPKQYHHFKKVFSEEELKWLPKLKPWDHAIDLKPDAPASFDCKIYPLSLKEQEALEEFLKEHQKKEVHQTIQIPIHIPFLLCKEKGWKIMAHSRLQAT